MPKVTPEGLIKLQPPVQQPLSPEAIERLGGEPGIDAMLARAEQELGQRHLETGCIDLFVACAEMGLAAHRLPPNLAAALQALLQALVLTAPTVEELRYRLVRKFKDQGETHTRAAELAVEAEKGQPYGGVDTLAVKKSFTKGRRIAEQRQRERLRRLNAQSVENKSNRFR
jgi:hypothetical protein